MGDGLHGIWLRDVIMSGFISIVMDMIFHSF